MYAPPVMHVGALSDADADWIPDDEMLTVPCGPFRPGSRIAVMSYGNLSFDYYAPGCSGPRKIALLPGQMYVINSERGRITSTSDQDRVAIV